MNVVFPAPSSPDEHDQVAGPQLRRRAQAPSARIDVGVGRVVGRGARGGAARRTASVPPDRTNPCSRQNLPVAGSSSRASTARSSYPRGVARPPRRTSAVATPWSRTSGSDPDPAQPERGALRVEHQRADVDARRRVRREQAAVRRAPRRSTPRSRPSASAGGSSGGRAAKAARTIGEDGRRPPRGRPRRTSSAHRRSDRLGRRPRRAAGRARRSPGRAARGSPCGRRPRTRAASSRRCGRAACGCARSRSACPRCRR